MSGPPTKLNLLKRRCTFIGRKGDYVTLNGTCAARLWPISENSGYFPFRVGFSACRALIHGFRIDFVFFRGPSEIAIVSNCPGLKILINRACRQARFNDSLMQILTDGP